MRGELTAVLGHNGSGKHLRKASQRDSASIRRQRFILMGWITVDEEKLYDIRQEVGMVFQNPDNQIVATVVEEDVAFGLENIGVPPKEMRERVDRALMDVGIYEYKNMHRTRLSGGQKQRVAIAGIIAMRPKCIVLDEPTAMRLTQRGRPRSYGDHPEIKSEYGITIVLITHYMDEAALCDRIIVMDSGKIILDDTPKEGIFQCSGAQNGGSGCPADFRADL